MTAQTDHVPTPSPGLVHLRRPAARSPALHRFVAAALADRDGHVLWIDAGGDARTLALDDHLPGARDLADVRVARAFTAYQHHELVRRTVRRAGDDTALVVAPCTAVLYGDDDVPDYLGRDLLDASLATLRELADALEVPAVVTTPGEGTTHGELVADAADRTLACERTRAGLRFSGPDVQTTVYHDAAGFQTTIPYWGALCGCVCDHETTTASPPTPQVEG
jgi:nucleotide-binding universal stress UspA family protein